MENYEKLLDEAYKKTKQIDVSGERFEIQKFLEEGIVFEPRPGKVRYLG